MNEFDQHSLISEDHISSFTIAILASHLIGIGIGHVIDPSFQVYAVFAGFIGIAYYVYSAYRFRQIRIQYSSLASQRIESRLREQIQIERSSLHAFQASKS